MAGESECSDFKDSTKWAAVEALPGEAEQKRGHCPYCDAQNNDFVPLNRTAEYSGIEMMLNRQGMLRVRYYTHNDRELFEAQDIVNVKYCPHCGAKMDGGSTDAATK